MPNCLDVICKSDISTHTHTQSYLNTRQKPGRDNNRPNGSRAWFWRERWGNGGMNKRTKTGCYPRFAAIFEHEPYVYCSCNHQLMEQLTLCVMNTRWQPGESESSCMCVFNAVNVVVLINPCFVLDWHHASLWTALWHTASWVLARVTTRERIFHPV